MTEKLTGQFGAAEELLVPDIPDASETVCHWLITAPSYHPAWSQYLLAVVRLREIPGRPPVVWQFDRATHEYLLVALDPREGLQDAATMAAYGEAGGGLPFLTPVNVCIQFEATDEEMRILAEEGARAVVNGWQSPETADRPEYIRTQWKASLVKTLAHIRGEVHAP